MSKKSKAESVPFLTPSIELINQIDNRLYEPINKYGCRFMSMIAIPQIVCGRALTPQQINEIYDLATTGQLGSNNIMDKNCTCKSEEHLMINYAFRLLGDKKRSCVQIFVSDAPGKYQNMDSIPSDKNLYFMIVDFNTSSDKRTYGGHHFVLFNAIGDLIYDPGGGSVKSWVSMNRWLCYKVFTEE